MAGTEPSIRKIRTPPCAVAALDSVEHGLVVREEEELAVGALRQQLQAVIGCVRRLGRCQRNAHRRQERPPTLLVAHGRRVHLLLQLGELGDSAHDGTLRAPRASAPRASAPRASAPRAEA